MVKHDSLHDQVCLITGASRGLGQEMALALTKRGVKLAIAARNRRDLRTTADAIEAVGGTVLAAPTDVRDEFQTRSLIQQVLNRYPLFEAYV